MIVCEDDAAGAEIGSIGDNFADRELCARFVAFKPGDVEAMRLVVHMRDPKSLPPWILFREAAGEKIAGGSETVELQWKFGTLISHTCLAMAAGQSQPAELTR